MKSRYATPSPPCNRPRPDIPQADLRVEQRHYRRSSERRPCSPSRSPEGRGHRGPATNSRAEHEQRRDDGGATRHSERDCRRRSDERVEEPFDAEAYLEATTFGFGNRHGYPSFKPILSFLLLHVSSSFSQKIAQPQPQPRARQKPRQKPREKCGPREGEGAVERSAQRSRGQAPQERPLIAGCSSCGGIQRAPHAGSTFVSDASQRVRLHSSREPRRRLQAAGAQPHHSAP